MIWTETWQEQFLAIPFKPKRKNAQYRRVKPNDECLPDKGLPLLVRLQAEKYAPSLMAQCWTFREGLQCLPFRI